jgi:hypothetical protein
MGARNILVVASTWIGTDEPDIDDPRLRTSFSEDIRWSNDPVPESWRALGRIEPTPSEEQMECRAFGSWLYFPRLVLDHWHREHDPEALQRKAEQERVAAERARQEGLARHAKYLAGLTLDKLRNKRQFTEWRGHVPQKALQACRDIFRDTIDALIDLGPKAKKRTKIAVLRQCIERLNELDKQHEQFICTIEREDLCEAFYEVTHAAGLKDCGDLADEWRDW